MRIVLLSLTPLLLIGAAGAGDDAKADLKRFQGKWDVTAAVSKGEKVPAEDVFELELTIDGEKIVIREKGRVQDRMTFKIDPSKKPRAIDFTHTEGGNKGKTDYGIYQFDGDTLKICVNEKSGADRPTVFESKAGSTHSLILLKRAK